MKSENVIRGGYYLKPRCIEKSKIANAPPQVREIWDWLIRNAEHRGDKKYGHTLDRGQVFCTINQIRDALHWMVGYRKETYKKASCENSMKWLVKEGMITTTKTTRGTIVTICNYSHYQDPKNYDCRNESLDESLNDAESVPNDRQESNKQRKKKEVKEKNTKKEKSPTLENLEVDHVKDWLNEKRAQGKFLTVDEFEQLEHFKNYCIANGRDKGKKAYANFVRAFQNSFSWESVRKKGQSNATDSKPLTAAEASQQWLEREYQRIDSEQEAQSTANQLSYQPEF